MQSCVLVRTEGTRCWQEVIPDCWTVSYWPFSVIWHDSVFHADTLTHSDLCLICNTVFISMKRRPVGLTIWNKRKLEVGENGGEKQGRVKKKNNGVRRTKVKRGSQSWDLCLCPWLKSYTAGEPCSSRYDLLSSLWAFKNIIIWKDHLKI